MKKVISFQSNDGIAYKTKAEAIRADRVHEIFQELNNSDLDWREPDIGKVAEFILSKYILTRKNKL
jgi:hypothetical protein